jgi:hypothetical protein
LKKENSTKENSLSMLVVVAEIERIDRTYLEKSENLC